MFAPRSSQPAKRCATSHIVANASRALGAAFAIASSISRARTSGVRPAPTCGPVEREHLRGVGRVDEEERGSVRDVVAEDLRRLVAVRRTAGGVQERDVVRVGELLRGRAGSSPSRTASTAVRNACSSGCPVPRSVASESAPTTSAARIGRSGVVSTWRPYSGTIGVRPARAGLTPRSVVQAPLGSIRCASAEKTA